MNVKYALALPAIISLSLAGWSHAAHAGFDLTISEVTVGEAPQKREEQPYDVQKGIDKSAPALKVFDEKYVPDSVRKKYNLPENWAAQGDGQAKATQAPEILTPEPMAETPQSEQLVVMPPPKNGPAVDSWRARKGENVRDVLRRWSDRQSVDLMWASPSTPNLQKDFSFFGNFQDAVNNLLKEAGGEGLHSQFRSEGLDPVIMAPASTITTNLPVPAEAQNETTIINIVPQAFQPAPAPKEMKETRWYGLSGTPLAEVLRVWSEDAGVDLIWQAESNYALKESVSQVGTFEDAVYKALSQYDNDAVRPVGEMYKDQNTGRKVLVIRTDAS
ncbi:MAG TPA: TcpQ domain-containing protein [Alphaproteobacteria bacterium]|nr:TcpQ domain-containing protein [Alphaproteobacteria bacterium]HNS44616.1 TcpQ domain-containing protein [Alphaproteobacteria bacterium]